MHYQIPSNLLPRGSEIFLVRQSTRFSRLPADAPTGPSNGLTERDPSWLPRNQHLLEASLGCCYQTGVCHNLAWGSTSRKSAIRPGSSHLYHLMTCVVAPVGIYALCSSTCCQLAQTTRLLLPWVTAIRVFPRRHSNVQGRHQGGLLDDAGGERKS